MGRIPRVTAPGVYHVTAKANSGGDLFLDDLDREDFLATVARVVERQLWTCHAYCLMTNHFHLMVETPDESLPDGMHRLNLAHAKSFNRRYRATGHVFQSRYYSAPVTTEGHALLLVRYIARNPVDAGICRYAGGVAVEQLWGNAQSATGSAVADVDLGPGTLQR
jgi:putative transposase